MKRMTCAIVLACVTCMIAGSPLCAAAGTKHAQNGLQLSIMTPDPSSIVDRFSIDVNFRGSSVETVELYLDNALVAKRQLNTSQTRGIISFTLDAMQLTEGSHEVLVKAFGPNGKPTTSIA